MSHLVERLAVRKGECLGDEGHQLLSGIVGEVDRMQTLVSELLDYSRVSGGPLERLPVDCARVLEQILDLLGDSVAERSATVTHGMMPVIHAHPTPVGQLFQNLVSNALKFARPDVARGFTSPPGAKAERGSSRSRTTASALIRDRRNRHSSLTPVSTRVMEMPALGSAWRSASGSSLATGAASGSSRHCGGGCSFHFTISDTATTSRKPPLELAALN